MPIFEYECPKCGIFDILQAAGEKSLRFCPTCAKKKKKSKVTKVVSSPAFHLKGTGWYKTDYASSSSSGSDKKSGEKKPAESSAGSKEKAASAKSESSKPAD